jgi:tetratricopeptide (TPR) repeat protein
MKLLYITFFFILFSSCKKEQIKVNFVNVSLDEAFSKAKTENKLLLVDFFSTTCNPCWKLLKDVFVDPGMSTYINSHFICIKITSEWEDYNTIRKKYNVQGLPTVIFFNDNGEELDRNCGYDGNKESYFKTIQDYFQGENTLTFLKAEYKKDSLSVTNNFNLAMKYINRWEFGHSVPYFKNVLRLDPDDTNGYQEQSRLNIAVDDARQRESVAPLLSFVSHANNLEFLGIAYGHILSYYENTHDTVNYLTTCDEALKKFPQKDIAYWRLLNYYDAHKDTVKYVELLERAVTYMPNDAGYLNRYAWAIYEIRRKDKYPYAIQLAEKALKLEPESAFIWDTLGWLYFTTGIKDQAIEAMKQAIAIDPQRAYYRNNLKKFRAKG